MSFIRRPERLSSRRSAFAKIQRRVEVRKQAEDVAKAKMPDLTAANLEAAVKTIAGSARSMGIIVEG